jgi:16S rRNA (uracil1498-N3)-methyltransferase
MNRFYCRSSDVQADRINIFDADQLHHLKDVLRFKPGEAAEIFDDLGNEYSVKLWTISAKSAEFRVLEKKPGKNHRKTRIVVACAIPKKSRIDDIVDKLTQLGVDRIIPLMSERVIVKMDKAKALERQKRWASIAMSASKQSQRNSVAQVDKLTDFTELISKSGEFDLKLIPNLIGKRKPLKDVLAGSKPQSVLVLIGPEGDFTVGEISRAMQSGFIPVSFGGQVLRVETACLFIASVLTYEFT